MRRLSISVLLGWLSALSLSADTNPAAIYINAAPLNVPPAVAPQINATSFVNQSIFDINLQDPENPYQMLNNLYFTNKGSGIITGTPGFRWDYFNGTVHQPMQTWINQGNIAASDFGLFSFGFFGSIPQSWVEVAAANITNRGPLSVGYSGLLKLQGTNVNVSRSPLVVDSPVSSFNFNNPFFFFNTTTLSSPVLIDDYWAVGTNGLFGGVDPNPTFIGSGLYPASPPFDAQSIFRDSYFIPAFRRIVSAGFGAGAFVYTNQISATSFVFHIVFVPTNNLDTNITTTVSFFPGFGEAADIQVDFTYPDYDFINETIFTNGVSLLDTIPFVRTVPPSVRLLPQVNPNPFGPTPFVPDVLSLNFYTGRSFFFGGTNGNAEWTNSLIFNPTYTSNRVFMPYAAYGASFPLIPGTNGGVPLFYYADPTNMPGRAEVLGKNLNMERTRVRAESTAILKTSNLASNGVARTDAPYVNVDLTTLHPSMIITNLAPREIVRLTGSVDAWTGIWTNYQVVAGTTNQLLFHLLVVNNTLQTRARVVVNEFAVHATNIVIRDEISVGKSMLLETKNLTVSGGLSLPGADPTLPVFFLNGWGWGSSNVSGLLNFTNDGTINIAGPAVYGADRPQPYSNFVNRGTNNAGSHWVRTLNFDNSSFLVTVDVSALFSPTAVSGPIVIDSPIASLAGIPPDGVDYNVPPGTRINVAYDTTGSRLDSGGDIEIYANNLRLSNAVVLAGNFLNGVTTLRITNSLTDGGPSAASYIWCNGGIDVQPRPAVSDLLGTTLIISAGKYDEFYNVWAGQDRGPNAIGYSNNLAIGRLVCNFGLNSLVFFNPVTLSNGLPGTNAMYVEYLELLNEAVPIVDTFAIDPNFTIYFANSNLDSDRIERDSGGRMRFVPSFAGPSSSVNYVAANGKVYKMNAALAASTTIDSDGDGIPNALDPKPFYTPDDAALSVSLTSEAPLCARLAWTAPANSTNTIEHTSAPGSANWQVLTNIVQGSLTGDLSVLDPLSPTGQLRVYRLRVNPAVH